MSDELGLLREELAKCKKERDELRERCTKLETDLAVANIKLTSIGKTLAIDAKGDDHV